MPPDGDATPLDDRVRKLLASGESARASEEAIRALGPAVLRFLRSRFPEDPDSADDAFAQWAEHVWSGLGEFRFGSALRTWSFRIARNVALNLRDEAWRRRGRRLVTGEASVIAAEVRTASAVRADRRSDALAELRASLDDAERELLSLRVDQALPHDEIAEILSGEGARISAAGVAKRFERLKDKLEKLARKRGLLD